MHGDLFIVKSRVTDDVNVRTNDISSEARCAAERIARVIRETPLQYSVAFSDAVGANVYLKLENEQHTGSFKLRGATNCLMNLSPEQRDRGCVVASSGNHGAAVAYAMRELDMGGVIFVPEQTSTAKVDAIRSYGGDVRFFGTDGLDTEQHARQFSIDNNMYYVSPYNDAAVIAGQGTCGVEIIREQADIDAVFIAVGGGGLISGVGSVLKSHNAGIRVYACQPEASAVMTKSIAAGHILDMPSEPTLSDGTAGGIETDAITFDLCREVVDEFFLVDEEEIAAAMKQYFESEGQEIEGAAGVAIAAMVKQRAVVRGKNVAVIICGGNVSKSTFESVMTGAPT
jgi:threonine dehydratase